MDFEYIALVIGIVLVSMTLHEAMHGFIAFFLGDDTAQREGRLTLNPIKHIDPFLTIILPVLLAIAGGPIFGGAKPVPFNPARVRYDEWGSALVALAGPLTNLILAFVSFGIYAIVGAADGSLLSTILITSFTVNIGFFAFNILPIPPLDGSRVLYALAPDFVRRGMEAIERYGIVVVFAIVLLASPLISRFMTGVLEFFIKLFSAIFGI